MTVVAPRSASVPPSPTSIAGDRAPAPGQGGPGPSDFETVLRGRTSRRAAVTTSARADDRRHHAAPGSATMTDPAAGVAPVVAPDVQLPVPAGGVAPVVAPEVQLPVPLAARPGDPDGPTAAGAPGLVTPGAAAALGDVASSAPRDPRASASATASAHPAPAVGAQPDAARSPGAVEQAPKLGAAAAATVTASPSRVTGRDDRVGNAARESASTAAANTPIDSTAYPLATPGGAAVGNGTNGTPVAAQTDSRPAQATLPPQAQVLNAMSPLVTTADGTHRLTVHLAPAHLGSVQVHVEVTGGAVTVRLTAADPVTGDVLRQGAAELRSHLEGLGLRSGGIEVQVALGDPARDLPGAAADSATPDRDGPGSGQRDSGPWTGAQTAAGHGDGPPDGGWHRHELPLDGWAPRHADAARPGGRPPATPPDSHRPPTHDVRVDVRL